MKSHLDLIESLHHRAYWICITAAFHWISPKTQQIRRLVCCLNSHHFCVGNVVPISEVPPVQLRFGSLILSFSQIAPGLSWAVWMWMDIFSTCCPTLCSGQEGPLRKTFPKNPTIQDVKLPKQLLTKRVVRLRSDQRNVHASTILFLVGAKDMERDSRPLCCSDPSDCI